MHAAFHLYAVRQLEGLLTLSAARVAMQAGHVDSAGRVVARAYYAVQASASEGAQVMQQRLETVLTAMDTRLAQVCRVV